MLYDSFLIDDIPDEEQARILEKAANEIVRRRLTAPAIFLLEMGKPFNFLGSQILIGLEPFIRSLFNMRDYRKFALIIERDENVERLIKLITLMSDE
jgi:hypothetical protein